MTKCKKVRAAISEIEPITKGCFKNSQGKIFYISCQLARIYNYWNFSQYWLPAFLISSFSGQEKEIGRILAL